MNVKLIATDEYEQWGEEFTRISERTTSKTIAIAANNPSLVSYPTVSHVLLFSGAIYKFDSIN